MFILPRDKPRKLTHNMMSTKEFTNNNSILVEYSINKTTQNLLKSVQQVRNIIWSKYITVQLQV